MRTHLGNVIYWVDNVSHPICHKSIFALKSNGCEKQICYYTRTNNVKALWVKYQGA